MVKLFYLVLLGIALLQGCGKKPTPAAILIPSAPTTTTQDVRQEQLAKSWLLRFDKDGDNQVTFDEYLAQNLDLLNKTKEFTNNPDKEGYIRNMFDKIDKNQDNIVSFAEILENHTPAISQFQQ